MEEIFEYNPYMESNKMSSQIISYIEAINIEASDNSEPVDILYIGECNYEIKKFSLKDIRPCFGATINNLSQISSNSPLALPLPHSSESNSSFTSHLVLSKELDEEYIKKIKNTVKNFNPTTMDEESALYDMKLLLYWIEYVKNSYDTKKIKFIFVAYGLYSDASGLRPHAPGLMI